MEIKAIMSHPVVTVRRKNTVKDAVLKMAKKGISCVVVVEKKLPIGIFTKHDLLSVLESGNGISKTPMELAMHTPVMPIEETDDLFTAARQMRMLEVRRFIIVDSSNRLTGVVTEWDVVRNYALRAFPYNLLLATMADKGLTASPRTPLKKLARMMLESRKNCVVILKNRRPVGIVNDSLFIKLAAKGEGQLKAPAEQKMARKMALETPLRSVREAVLNLMKLNMREIVVTDEEGFYYGIVTQRDLVNYIEKNRS